MSPYISRQTYLRRARERVEKPWPLNREWYDHMDCVSSLPRCERRIRSYDVARLEDYTREEEMLAYRVICDGFEAGTCSKTQAGSNH